MLLLTSTSDLIQVVTSAAASVVVHASYIDNNAGTITPARTNTAAITSATTTTVVASPSASVQRNVKFLNIVNNSGSASTNVTVQHTDGTNVIELISVTLLPSEDLVLSSTGDWQHHDSNGADYAYNGSYNANMGPTNTIAETLPRQNVIDVAQTAMTSGTVYMSSVYLNAGQLVSNITYYSVAAAVGAVNSIAGLYSSNQSAPALLATSANNTVIWPALTARTFAMTTAYRVPTSGVYYVALMNTAATTMPTVRGNTPRTLSVLTALAPMTSATSSTGQTTTLPATGAALTVSLLSIYANIT